MRPEPSEMLHSKLLPTFVLSGSCIFMIQYFVQIKKKRESGIAPTAAMSWMDISTMGLFKSFAFPLLKAISKIFIFITEDCRRSRQEPPKAVCTIGPTK
jgi:hypothetical protein